MALKIVEVDPATGTFVGEHHSAPSDPGARKYSFLIVDARTLEGEGNSATLQPPIVKIVLRKTK